MQLRYNLGVLLAAVAFLVYLFTLSPYPFPGQSAHLLVLHTGLNDFTPSTHFIWNRVVALFSLIPFASSAWKINLASAVFGALCVWLTYLLGSQIRFQNVGGRRPDARVAEISGSVAAAFLALAPPFWQLASRAHYMTFDLCLFITAAYLLVRFRNESRGRYIYFFSFVYGIGIIEYPVFILVAPFACLYVGYLIFIRKRRINRNYFFGILIAAAAGLSVYAPIAFLYTRSNNFEWLNLTHGVDLHMHLWGHHLLQLQRHIPRVGWLTYLLIGLVPLIAAAAGAARRDGFRKHRFGLSLLYGWIVVLALVIHAAPHVPAFDLLGPKGVVLPAFFLALALGYAAGFFYLLSASERGATGRSRRQRKRSQRLFLSAATATAVVLFLIPVPFNYVRLRTHPAKHLTQWAETILETMAPRTWMVSEGAMGNLLLLTARERDQALTYIDARSVPNKVYRKWMASRVESPRLQSLAEIGLTPLLKEWMRVGEDVTQKLVFFDQPDAWELTSFSALPYKTFFVGVREAPETYPSNILNQSIAYWADVADRVERREGAKHDLAPYLDYQGAHLAKIANFTGYRLENEGRHEEAIVVFDLARRLHPDNLFAKLNLYSVRTRQGIRADDQEALYIELQERLNDPRYDRAYSVLAHRLGPLAHQEDLRIFGQFRRLPVIAPEDEIGLREVINDLLAGRKEKAREWLEYLVEENPTYEEAWMLLGQVAYDQKDMETFQRCITHMRRLDKKWTPLLLTQALIAKEKGEFETVKMNLKQILETEPTHRTALVNLILIAMEEDDDVGIRRHASRLLFADPDNVLANYAMGFVKLKEEQYEQAESFYLKSIRRPLKPPFALNNLAWVLQRQGKYERALYYINEGLQIPEEREQPKVWHTLAIIHLGMGNLAEAGRALARTLDLDPRDLDGLKAMAEWLHRSGHIQEASSLRAKLQDPTLGDLTERQIENLKALAKGSPEG